MEAETGPNAPVPVAVRLVKLALVAERVANDPVPEQLRMDAETGPNAPVPVAVRLAKLALVADTVPNVPVPLQTTFPKAPVPVQATAVAPTGPNVPVPEQVTLEPATGPNEPVPLIARLVKLAAAPVVVPRTVRVCVVVLPSLSAIHLTPLFTTSKLELFAT